jgi:hypothetical protein
MQAKARLREVHYFLFTRFLQEGGQYDSVDIFEMDLDIWELLMNFLWRYFQVQKVSPKSA